MKKSRYYIYGHDSDGTRILEFTTNSEKRALELREYVKTYRKSASIVDTSEFKQGGIGNIRLREQSYGTVFTGDF